MPKVKCQNGLFLIKGTTYHFQVYLCKGPYGWIADQRHAHKKSICQRTARATTLSNLSGLFLCDHFLTSYFLKQVKTGSYVTKIVRAELDSPT